MRIAIDLDGTICPLKRPTQSYDQAEAIPRAAERIRELRASGHYVIIQTARHMATCDGNLGLVMKRVGTLTLDWLERHGIEYDEVLFGMPNAGVNLDDRAMRFESWAKITDKRLRGLPCKR